MKNSLKTKISHLFKSKSNKLEKYPTYDQSCKNEENIVNIKSNLGEEKINKNKKSHKKAKTNLKLLDTSNLKEFPILPSPINDPNESSKLTAQEFAKAVGIKILHRTDEEEDEDCDCDYCKTAYSNINNMISMDPNNIDNNALTQPIPNVSLNQYTVNTASISSSNNSTLGNNNNDNINIPPLPTNNLNYNDKLSKCSSNTSLNTSVSNHSIVNSRTIGTPGYYCHRNRKNSVSKVIDMSLFVPPSEQEVKNKTVQSSSLSINTSPESSSIQTISANEIVIGGSLGRNRNTCQKKTYYGVGISQSNSTRERSRSHSIANACRARMINTELKTSPIIKENASHIQFKVSNRCDTGTELANANGNAILNVNANSNINPSSPNKRPYPPSLASSSSSTTLSSSLSLTYISKPNLNSVPSSQSSSQLSHQKTNELQHSQSLQNVKISSSNTSLNSINYPLSSSSVVTPIKPHSSFKITRSITISEGTRRAEIDVQPMEPDEVRVYTKGRFTITCEHTKRPSIPKFQIN